MPLTYLKPFLNLLQYCCKISFDRNIIKRVSTNVGLSVSNKTQPLDSTLFFDFRLTKPLLSSSIGRTF